MFAHSAGLERLLVNSRLKKLSLSEVIMQIRHTGASPFGTFTFARENAAIFIFVQRKKKIMSL